MTKLAWVPGSIAMMQVRNLAEKSVKFAKTSGPFAPFISIPLLVLKGLLHWRR